MTPILESIDTKARSVEVTPVGSQPTDPAVLSAMLDRTRNGHLEEIATASDDGASDFDITPMNEAQQVPTAAPALAPLRSLAAVQPNYSSVASLTAPDPLANARVAEAKGQTGTVWHWLKKEADLAPLIAEIKNDSTALHALRRDLNARGLAPGSAKQQIDFAEQSLVGGASADTLIAMAEKISRLRAITPTMEAAASQIVAKQVEAMRAKALAILALAGCHLAAYLTAAEDAELAFYNAHGLQHEKTAVSHRIDAVAAHVTGIHEVLQPHTMLPGGFNVWVFDPATALGPLAR